MKILPTHLEMLFRNHTGIFHLFSWYSINSIISNVLNIIILSKSTVLLNSSEFSIFSFYMTIFAFSNLLTNFGLATQNYAEINKKNIVISDYGILLFKIKLVFCLLGIIIFITTGSYYALLTLAFLTSSVLNLILTSLQANLQAKQYAFLNISNSLLLLVFMYSITPGQIDANNRFALMVLSTFICCSVYLIFFNDLQIHKFFSYRLSFIQSLRELKSTYKYWVVNIIATACSQADRLAFAMIFPISVYGKYYALSQIVGITYILAELVNLTIGPRIIRSKETIPKRNLLIIFAVLILPVFGVLFIAVTVATKIFLPLEYHDTYLILTLLSCTLISSIVQIMNNFFYKLNRQMELLYVNIYHLVLIVTTLLLYIALEFQNLYLYTVAFSILGLIKITQMFITL